MFAIDEVISAPLELFSDDVQPEIKKERSLDKFILHVKWKYNPRNFEIIMAALLLDKNERLTDLVIKGRQAKGIRLLTNVNDDSTDFLFDVASCSAEKVRFIATVGSSRLYGETFTDVSAPDIRLIDGNSYKQIESVAITDSNRRSTAIVIGEYTKGGGFIGLGDGYNYSLDDYVQMYGGQNDF